MAIDVHQTTFTISKPLTMTYAPLKVQHPVIMDAQEHLSKFIIHNVDCMAEIWSSIIHLSRTCSAFVDVHVLEDFIDDKSKTMHEYKEVFGNATTISFKRILIQGDPGCSKSTYANKIALDWANKNEYLRDKFHSVFMIPLETLSTNIEQAIRTLLPQRSIGFVEDYYKHHSSKVLLILDGFDDLPEDSQFYSEVMRMLNGKRTLLQLHFFGVDKSNFKDPYDFVKALVENAVKIEKETKGIRNDEEQLQLLGEFAFQKFNSEMLNVMEKFFPMRETFLSKLANIFKVLTTCINDKCWLKLSQLDLSWNSNVGSTPALFAALGGCKQLKRLDLQQCSLSIESINRLTTCIDDKCWLKLTQSDLSGNSNVGSTPA